MMLNINPIEFTCAESKEENNPEQSDIAAIGINMGKHRLHRDVVFFV